ncbi:MAG: pilus assembly protein N-terminal domain-containing protein [Pirellulaceae bacterium]
MLRSSLVRRYAPRRGRQFVATALCAASFLAGQWLLAGEPSAGPRTVWNQYLKEEGVRNQEPEVRNQRSAVMDQRSEVRDHQPQRIEGRPLLIEGFQATTFARSTPAQLAPVRSAPVLTPPVTSDEASLPPIVPAAAMPRRLQQSAERGTRNAERFTPTRSVSEGQLRTVAHDVPYHFTLQQPAQLPALEPAALPSAESAPGLLPPGSPFETVTESGTLTIRARRSMLLRTKIDIYRTAVVDESICDIVQFTPREISLIGRAQGNTHVTFWFDDPAQPPLTYLVQVEPDADAIKQVEIKYQLLEDLVNEMFPDSKIGLVVLADKLLVKGQAKDSEEAAQIMTIVRSQGQSSGAIGDGAGPAGWGVSDAAATGVIPAVATGLANQPTYQLINMLRVPGVQQVALRVKIAELNRSAARGFGVNLQTNLDFGDAVHGSQLLLSSLLNSQTGGTSVIADISGDDASIGVRYLQQHGVIRLLSEPTLVTLSGKPATFVAGGEFAVPTVVGSVGLSAVTTEFRAFGAIISFLPTVVDKDRIRLQVAPEFSQINSQLTVGGTPGLNVRSATTTVEMREGQTLAIAGLLEDNYTATSIGDLPLLAKIFGRRNASRNETELIILVTPELVHPLEPEEVPPLPGFDVTEPTNAEFFLHGDLEGRPTSDYRSTVWPRLKKRYGGPAMTSGPFGHGK